MRLPWLSPRRAGLDPGVGTNAEVWVVAQRRGCFRGRSSLYTEMLVSPNANKAA